MHPMSVIHDETETVLLHVEPKPDVELAGLIGRAEIRPLTKDEAERAMWLLLEVTLR